MNTIFSNNVLLDSNIVNNFTKTFQCIYGINMFSYEDFAITEEIKFNDDNWNLLTYDSLERSSTVYNFDFTVINERYKYYAKKLVLEKLIISEYAITTVKSYFLKCKKFIVFLNENAITSTAMIDLNLVKKFFLSIKHTKEHNKCSYKYMLSDLLQEIELVEKVSFDSIYDFLNYRNTILLRAEKENGKTDIIPRSIFNNIVSLALKDIKSNSTNIRFKKIACIMIILCETGMRVGELIRIEVNKLICIEVINNSRLNYLEFKTYKTANCKDFRWTECFANEKVTLAYNTLLELDKNIRKTKYLYISSRTGAKINEDTLTRHMLVFFATHQQELGFELLSKYDLELIKIKHLSKDVQGILGVNLYDKMLLKGFIYTFSPHQFRVTVCTQLYNQGVDLEWIRLHMNHLSTDMTLHYIRLNNIKEKDLLIAETLKVRMDSDGDYLETDISKVTNTNILDELSNPELNQYYKDINTFLEKNKFTIKKDLDEIIKVLTRVGTPLMEMEFGYCAQHALSRVCSRQEYISTLDDAYHIKPQVPNLQSIEFTYKRFIEKSKIVKHNKKVAKKNVKYTLEYEREEKALKSFINNRLLPEISMLKEELTKLGTNRFLNTYPNLKKIVNKIDTIIEKEVEPWI